MAMLSVAALDLLPTWSLRDEQKVDELFFSIKEVGLIHPLIVLKNQEVDGRYTVLDGGHRKIAVERLKWGEVDCAIRKYNDVHAEMVTLSANLHRANYTGLAYDKAIARYAELYTLLHPSIKATAAAQKTAAQKRPVVANGRPAPVVEVAAPAPKVKPAVAAIAKNQGVSERTVRDAIVRADGFSDEARAILEAAGISKDRMTKLAKVRGTEKDQIINLIAADVSYSEAMREVLGDKYVGTPEDEDELGDEDWLRQCRARPGANIKRFDAAALRYRQIRGARIAFQRAIAWGDMKSQINAGDLYSGRLLRFLETPHPKDWVNCPKCKKGMVPSGECPSCKGGGFLLG